MPLVIKRRHGSKLIVPPVGATAARASASYDLPLIRTLGKAFYWQRMIDTGEVANASELARSLKLEVGWVCEVLRMTRLAPDIIRAIMEGRQPRHLNLHAMRGRQGEVRWIGRNSGRSLGLQWTVSDRPARARRTAGSLKPGRHGFAANTGKASVCRFPPNAAIGMPIFGCSIADQKSLVAGNWIYSSGVSPLATGGSRGGVGQRGRATGSEANPKTCGA